MKKREPYARPMGWRKLPAALTGVVLVALCASGAFAAFEKVGDGVKFSYYDPDAGAVYVAGSFNGWNTTATTLTRDDEGNWSGVVALGPGTHEYKFVVDGAWITDPDNPTTKDDGYGGTNSLIEIDSKGEIVDTGRALPTSNTALNPKVFIGGRYLSRTNVEKDAADDPRWRMQRPEQNVDFNFNVTISGLVRGYARMRFDTGEKILQPNNISAFLDEAHINVTTEWFDVTGFHNEETLRSNDPFSLVGDVDLAGTIFDDHVQEGKGQAGVSLKAQRNGVEFQGILSNVHDYDIYNDPNLFDNTGTDVGFARLSHQRWDITGGANFYIVRNLWWLDLTDRVGAIPANTGLPRLDAHIDSTGDTSDWFEFEDEVRLFGGDLTAHLLGGKLQPSFEFLIGTVSQGFVTSNNSGDDFGNGAIDVPILDRDMRLYHGSIESTQIENVRLNLEHTYSEMINPSDNENTLTPVFMEDEVANKRIFFVAASNPATQKGEYTEVEASWAGTRYSAALWLQRQMLRWEPVVDDAEKFWAYDASASPRVTARPHDRLDLELEQQWRWQQWGMGQYDVSTIETILRGSYDIGKNVSAIFDVRHVNFKDELLDETDNFTAPFAGIQYDPTRKVTVVLAYGVDPLDFDIDYRGRNIGRERYRREYRWVNPEATARDAEEALADQRMITVRAIYSF